MNHRFHHFLLLSSKQGEWVWVKPLTKEVYDLPFAAKIFKTDKEKSLILDDDDQELWVSNNQVIIDSGVLKEFLFDNKYFYDSDPQVHACDIQ